MRSGVRRGRGSTYGVALSEDMIAMCVYVTKRVEEEQMSKYKQQSHKYGYLGSWYEAEKTLNNRMSPSYM